MIPNPLTNRPLSDIPERELTTFEQKLTTFEQRIAHILPKNGLHSPKDGPTDGHIHHCYRTRAIHHCYRTRAIHHPMYVPGLYHLMYVPGLYTHRGAYPGCIPTVVHTRAIPPCIYPPWYPGYTTLCIPTYTPWVYPTYTPGPYPACAQWDQCGEAHRGAQA